MNTRTVSPHYVLKTGNQCLLQIYYVYEDLNRLVVYDSDLYIMESEHFCGSNYLTFSIQLFE